MDKLQWQCEGHNRDILLVTCNVSPSLAALHEVQLCKQHKIETVSLLFDPCLCNTILNQCNNVAITYIVIKFTIYA